MSLHLISFEVVLRVCKNISSSMYLFCAKNEFWSFGQTQGGGSRYYSNQIVVEKEEKLEAIKRNKKDKILQDERAHPKLGRGVTISHAFGVSLGRFKISTKVSFKSTMLHPR